MEGIPGFDKLFQKLLDNSCSHEEVEKLIDMLSSPELPPEIKRVIEQQLADPVSKDEVGQELRLRYEEGLNEILSKQRHIQVTSIHEHRRTHNIWKYAAACIFLVVTIYWLYPKGKTRKTSSAINTATLAYNNPDHRKPVLTLADGSRIELDSAKKGLLTVQASTEVMQTDSGRLFYKTVDTGTTKILYNTLSTPIGVQYAIQLPDGSNVWLNAASSIRFPTRFAGNERSVQLTGEACFEVTPDAGKPFRVNTGKTCVEVLGTLFNLKAYEEDDFERATLLQGAVRIIKGTNKALLNPGQAALLNNGSEEILVRDVDAEEEVAWKNGMFRFSATDLKLIMREISRWYNVDVRYEGDVSRKYITGEAPRSTSLSELLEVLKLNHVHLRIEGRTIIVKE